MDDTPGKTSDTPSPNGQPGSEAETERQPAPRLLAGSRAVSLAGLLELIEKQFNAETGTRPDLLQADEAERRTLLREVIDYVLAVESIRLPRADRMAVIEAAYRDLFHFGPLDSILSDPEVTEVKVAGYNRVYVRRASGELQEVHTHFNDPAHLDRVVQRAILGTGAALGDPFVEVGVSLAGRPMRLTVTGAPISTTTHVHMRLHPAQPRSLPDLVRAGTLDESAAQWLEKIVTAGHGLMLVGAEDTGKTSLLQALLPLVAAQAGRHVAVERATELRLPDGVQSLVANAAAFGDMLNRALDFQADLPGWLLVDEVRFDEAAALWRALIARPAPRCLFALRGSTDAFRLRTAFSMAIRRAEPSIDQTVINSALLDRLPFAVLLARRERQIRLLSIGEWQSDSPDQPGQIELRPIWPEQPGVSVAPRKLE